MTSTRQLSAIMFTDMVGFTALMQTDESRARAAVDRHRDAVRAAVSANAGELVQFYGDGTLSLFRSAVDAADCAVAIQTQLSAATTSSCGSVCTLATWSGTRVLSSGTASTLPRGSSPSACPARSSCRRSFRTRSRTKLGSRRDR